ncbi:signal peptide peptidase SppA [Termitidicoccus mucosus]|uniref:Signal peptide peptidase SppA n=1 Tax=Termitidicoccus mucosus TaxID=1184151 RepID=A0A178IK71_9BACT|nr:signal peptide peptidase SppA [Opitutaceae bacterium TSB47]
MKNFFTSLLGSLVALVIFSLGAMLCSFLLIVVIASLGGGGKKKITVEKGSYLVLDMSVNITDAPPHIDRNIIAGALAGGGGAPPVLQLREATRALRSAASDRRIAGVFLHGRFAPADYGTGYAALKEIREALQAVKAAQKPVIAFLDSASVREMYLASLADEIVLDPYGELLMPGLASEPAFFAGAFEKFGVGVQVTRVGKYKSAIEPYTRTDMSPESREQMQKLLGDIWDELRGGVAAARGLTTADVQKIVDTEGLIRPESALDAGLVTRLAYRDEIIDEMKIRTGRAAGENEPFLQIALADYVTTVPVSAGPSPAPVKTGTAKTGGSRVAVVYAEGVIVDGHGAPNEIGGERFAREIRRLRQDEDIAAIVLRVNSPGGSASASEHIQRELRVAAHTKPVIVSMGTYAASGGYWISAYGNRIFAGPGTITGSIGVFGVQFDIQRLSNNLGVTYDSVKTGKFADAITITRPKTEEELAVVQRMVDWIYDEFVGKVADARGIARERVHEIAQGRVWSGAEALRLGLVDEIGGLDDAIAYAAGKAGLKSGYKVTEYPRKKEFAEVLAELFQDIAPNADARTSVTDGAVDQAIARLKAELSAINQFNDPKGIYARLPLELMVR